MRIIWWLYTHTHTHTHRHTHTHIAKINRGKRNITLKTDCFQPRCRRRENSFLIESTATCCSLITHTHCTTCVCVCVCVWRTLSIRTIRHFLTSLKPDAAAGSSISSAAAMFPPPVSRPLAASLHCVHEFTPSKHISVTGSFAALGLRRHQMFRLVKILVVTLPSALLDRKFIHAGGKEVKQDPFEFVFI